MNKLVDILKTPYIASGSSRGVINIYNALNTQIRGIGCKGRSAPILVLHSQGDILCAGTDDSYIHIFNIYINTKSHSLLCGNLGISAICSLGEEYIASGGHDCTIYIHNVEKGNILYILKGHTQCINCLILHSNGKLLSASDDWTIKIFNTTTQTREFSLIGHFGSVYQLIELQSGYVVSCSLNYLKCIIIWDIEMLCPIHTITGRKGIDSTFSMAVLSSGQILAGCQGGYLRLWNMIKFRSISTCRVSHLGLITNQDKLLQNKGKFNNVLRVMEIGYNGHILIANKGFAPNIAHLTQYSTTIQSNKTSRSAKTIKTRKFSEENEGGTILTLLKLKNNNIQYDFSKLE